MANNKNLKPFKKGKSGNEKWRPRKFLAEILFDLKAEGFEEVKPRNVSDVYQSLLWTPRAKLKKLAQDRTIPYIISSTAMHMLTARGFDTQQTMLDRVHGRAVQKIEQSTKTELTITDPKKAQRVKALLWIRKKK